MIILMCLFFIIIYLLNCYKMLKEFSKNPYLISLVASIIGVVLYFLYSKYYKKEEVVNNIEYIKIFSVILVLCIGTYMFKGDIKLPKQKGGGSMEDLIDIGEPGF